MRAADVMTQTVITVRPQTSLAEAVERMLQNSVSALVVVDEAERVAGILSEGDLLRRAETETERHRPHWLEFLLGPGRLADEFAHAHGRIVAEVMSPEVIWVEEDTPLEKVVQLFEQHRIRRVPVLRDDALVGIVSRADLLRALSHALAQQASQACDDETLCGQVVAAIAKIGWLPREGITISAKDGIVALEGVILDSKEREALRVAAEGVPGVKAVKDRLVWVEPVSGGIVGGAPAESEG